MTKNSNPIHAQDSFKNFANHCQCFNVVLLLLLYIFETEVFLMLGVFKETERCLETL